GRAVAILGVAIGKAAVAGYIFAGRVDSAGEFIERIGQASVDDGDFNAGTGCPRIVRRNRVRRDDGIGGVVLRAIRVERGGRRRWTGSGRRTGTWRRSRG